MIWLTSLVVGLLAGTHSATWGMYKDSPHEGFTWPKYVRSIVLAGLVALSLVAITGFEIARPADIVVLYGVTYVVERAMLEFYKTFLRQEDQSKYEIPMQLHVDGKLVEGRLTRLGIGLVYLLAVLLIGFGIHRLQLAELRIPSLIVVLIVGSLGGWVSAFGGAWKDAPIEGFETLKFFRSPVIALLYSLMMASFTRNYLLMAMGALGFTIGTIETYKTFCFPNTPRGKFAGKPINHPEMLRKRQKFVPLYVAIWLAIIATIVIAYIQPRDGLL